jgi:hypothetical protein
MQRRGFRERQRHVGSATSSREVLGHLQRDRNRSDAAEGAA